jgi:hypothetical protein
MSWEEETVVDSRLGRWALRAVLVSLLLGRSALGTGGAPSWSLSLVSGVDPGAYATSPTLAFDHYGTPSVGWSQAWPLSGVNSVRHSQLLGTGLWSHREVATGQGVGLMTSLSFDRAERPTVAWLDGDGSVSAEFNGGGVQQMAASGAGTAHPVLSISHDLAGNLRGMYGEATPGVFSDIGYSGGAFSSGPLTTLGGLDVLMGADLVTDHQGLRHIAARATLGGGGEAVMIASEPPGGGIWPAGPFVIADAIRGLDIAVDPTDGNIALAYTTLDAGTSTSSLYYSKFNGVSMDTTLVASSIFDVFEDTSLAFDFSDGRPAIAYEQRLASPSAEHLMFAYLDGAQQWQTSLVDDSIAPDAPGGMPRAPSLAYDDYGTSWPAIAYADADGSMTVAFDPPVPEPGALGLACIGLGLIARRRR